MKEFIKKIKQDNPIENCLFFKDILDNKISLDSFKSAQYNFYSAVTFFSRPMSMICSKIDDYNLRWRYHLKSIYSAKFLSSIVE